ncbi:hypothetical protein DPMN_079984 [Dreissena polymorpha]|uniref:Uncharacterized protein n=1 Tax=Dreissena polymorpha TaxID=45954 RepID=A0A9D3YVH4_DREPO|nr:hypothetical protein DPMN_079984 [Dreissena polymorpha]
MIRSKELPAPMSGKSAFTYFLVRTTNETSSENAIGESVQDIASIPEGPHPRN